MSIVGLTDLAVAAGISPVWTDYRGAVQQVDDATLQYTLESLGLPARGEAQVAESRQQLREESAKAPLLLTADCGTTLPLPADLPDHHLSWRHEDTGAETAALVAAGHVVAPSTPGYYGLTAGSRAVRVAVAPASALPSALVGARRWGLSTQLYSLPRSGDQGIGDFGSLARLAAWSAGEGADALAISPAHALFTADLNRFSPYSPSSRLFLNALYADAASAGIETAESHPPADGAALIDWPSSSAARLQTLRQQFTALRQQLEGSRPLAQEFARFIREGGERLLQHARFEVLSAHSRAQGGSPTWREWQQCFRDPASAEVKIFCDSKASHVQFHLFAQWLADRSLGAAHATARNRGMAIGLVGDLAVGTDSGGSHSWSLQGGMLQGLSVGAPPDLMASQGQNWGLTTFSPRALRTGGFAGFIELLRANLRRVGGLRIDHILGLRRLWLSPDGHSASRGVYVDYPLDDLLRLVRLEAWRHQALIIGEDLGTVPVGFREQLHASGILGMQVLWFERHHGFFVEPARWSAQAVATTTTHDVPTLARWWQGADLDWRQTAGQFLSESQEKAEREERQSDRAALWAALEHQQLVEAVDAPPDAPEALIDAAIDFVAATPSPLMLLPMEDLLGLAEQPNVPGTTDEHPNWRRRLPVNVDALDTSAAVKTRLARLRSLRPKT